MAYRSNLEKRIYVGNLLATITPDFLFKIYSSYGRVITVQKKYPTYAFVEFDNELSAINAIKFTNGIEFNGKRIFVNKVKSDKNVASVDGEMKTEEKEEIIDQIEPLTSGLETQPIMRVHHCEIIAERKTLRPFAEQIESMLMTLGISSDIVFMNPSFDKAKVLGQFRENGSLYAIIITHQHVTFNSVTITFLQGEAIEHRDIPLNDGINLIYKDFESRKKGVNDLNSHPLHILKFLENLMKNTSLTVSQYDALINYLAAKKENQIKIEVGENSKPDEKNLTEKIYQMLNNKIPPSRSMDEIERKKIMEQIKYDERVKNALKNIKRLQ